MPFVVDGSREMEHYNYNFVSAWKDTHNYKMWNSQDSPGILEINPGHPFAGQLSVSDMKLRLSQYVLHYPYSLRSQINVIFQYDAKH